MAGRILDLTLTWWFFCVAVWTSTCGQTVSDLRQIDLASWQQAYNENQKLLIFFYAEEGCASCEEVAGSISQIIGQPEIPSGVEFARSADPELSTKLQIREYPGFVFLRDKSAVLYDGQYEVEDLLEWVQLAGQKATQRLDQDSFEHLTQASTGATTGDWLVVFYKETCRDILTALETLGVRLRGRVNVAKVSTADSPLLVDRFKVKACPEVILFKQGKMYRYELPAQDAASLRSFVEGFYKNVKAENVPVQKSNFDILTETIADSIKTQVEGENGTIVIGSIAAAAVLLFLILICCCRSLLAAPPKQKTE